MPCEKMALRALLARSWMAVVSSSALMASSTIAFTAAVCFDRLPLPARRSMEPVAFTRNINFATPLLLTMIPSSSSSLAIVGAHKPWPW